MSLIDFTDNSTFNWTANLCGPKNIIDYLKQRIKFRKYLFQFLGFPLNHKRYSHIRRFEIV